MQNYLRRDREIPRAVSLGAPARGKPRARAPVVAERDQILVRQCVSKLL
jgi:hypothetical protein